MSKNVLITGASRGIGKAISFAFAAAGYDLILVCQTSREQLCSIKKELELNYHINCQIFFGDISNPDFAVELFSSIHSLDVLINNAGISYVGLLSDMSVSDWNRVLSTNLSSCFFCSKQAIPLMLHKKSGRIINISSMWGNVGASMEVAYSASKGGLNAFTKALAKELAPSNIQVNAIACGVIDTDMNHCFSKEEMDSLISEIPADRLGQPEEVANLALQLASAPSYLTGQIITLDGALS